MHHEPIDAYSPLLTHEKQSAIGILALSRNQRASRKVINNVPVLGPRGFQPILTISLFSERDLTAFFNNRLKGLEKEIDHLSEDMLGDIVIENLQRNLVQKYKVDLLKVEEPVSDYNSEGAIEVEVKFSGTADLLGYQPRNFTTTFPRGSIEGDLINSPIPRICPRIRSRAGLNPIKRI